MKIKSVYIDGLHNAANKVYNFGDINYIFGNNGIGKSTILQAIQFALLGYIPGTSKNSKEALLRHSPKGAIDVRVVVSYSGEDITIQRKVTAAGNKLTTIPDGFDVSSIIADIETPIFNFNEFVGQTANKLKEYFIKNILPTSDGKINWVQILKDSIIDCNFQDRDSIVHYGLSLIPEPDDTGDILEQVIKANAKFKEEQSFKKSELQRLQNTIDSLIYYDDYFGPKDIAELNSQLLALGSIRDQVIKYNAAVDATKSMDTELISLRKRIEDLGGRKSYEEFVAKLPEINKQMSELSAQISNNQKEQDRINTEIANNARVISGNGVCPYTKNECSAIAEKIKGLQAENLKYESERNKLVDEYTAFNHELYLLTAKSQEYDRSIRDFKNICDRIKTLEATMQELPEKPNTDKDLFALDQEISKLTQLKEKLQANIQYNETIENLTGMKYESELQLEALNKWVKVTDTNGLQTTLMLDPFEELAKTMTNYITTMYGRQDLKAHFNISTKANSFNFGLIRDNVYIPYDLLSSGEKCLYSLALMICITNNSKSPLKLLLLDDAFDHLDSSAIENTFEALKIYNKVSETPIQFIFAGVKECSNASDVLLKV